MATTLRGTAPREVIAEEPNTRPMWEFVRSSGLRSLVVGTSRDPNAKVTILLVSAEDRPVLAIKAPTTDAAADAVENETRALREIGGLVPDELSSTIPRVVDVVDFDGRPALVMTALQGLPMTTSYVRWRHTASPARVQADFAAVDVWLSDFQRATVQASAPLEMDAGVSSRLRSRFGDDPELESDLERLAEIYDRLGGSAVPRTAIHGDMWFGNVLLGTGGVSGVVDWEVGSRSGEPVRDLARFAHMYALYLDRRTKAGRRVAGHPGLRADGWGAGVEFALNGAGWFPDLFRRFLRGGLVRLGASPESWRDAALAGIAEVAAFTDDHAFARRHLVLFRQLHGPRQGTSRTRRGRSA